MAEHLGDILHQAHDRRRLAADLAEPGEVEKLLGDPLAAERLGLDQLEVAARHPGLVVVGHEAGEPALQRFGAHRDRGEGIVDFVGDPRGEKADTRQLLAANHLTRPQLHLPVEVVADLLESLRHVIEGLGELRHLVAAVEVEPESEVAGGHAPGAVAEEAERPKHPAVGEDAKRRQQERRRHRRRPGGDDEGPIPGTDVAGEIEKVLLEVGREGSDERGEATEVGAEAAEFPDLHSLARGRPTDHLADPHETRGDAPGRLALTAPVSEGGVVDLPLPELLDVRLEGPFGPREYREERSAAGAELTGFLVTVILVLALLDGDRGQRNDRQGRRRGGEGRHIAGQGPRMDQPQRRHAFAEITRQWQLGRPAAQAAHESAVGIRAEEAARRKERHHEDDKPSPHHELAADGASLAHSVLQSLHDRPGLLRSIPAAGRGLGGLRGRGRVAAAARP